MSSERERAARRESRELQRERQPTAPSASRPPYGTRLIAGGIDLLLAGVPLLALFFAVAHTAPAGTIGLGGSLDITIGSTEHYLTGSQGILFVGLIVGIWAAVFGLIPAMFGSTVGMFAMGLRLVGLDGQPVPFGRHITRTALWIVDGFPYVAPGLMAFFVIIASPSRRRVGDMVARTAVIHLYAPVPGETDAAAQRPA